MRATATPPTKPPRSIRADVVIDLDERRRVSLGKIGRKEHTRYHAQEKDDGTIILTPAAVVHPELAARLKAAMDEVRAGGKLHKLDDVLKELGLEGE